MAAAMRLLRAEHIPNGICVLRILLVWPIVVALLDDRYLLALGLIVVAGLSDGLDGFLAKRFNWRTRLGGILDPAADKLLLVSVYVTLTATGLIPLWLTVIVIARDLVIVSGTLSWHWLIGPVEPEPSMISKLNTAMQLLFCVSVVANQALYWPPQPLILVAGATVMVTSVVSGLDYVLRWSARAFEARRRR